MADPHRSRRMLRNVLSLPPVQDRVFGEHSQGGLDWQDYNNVAGLVGPVVWEQGGTGDRIFPLRCQERQAAPDGTESTCNNLISAQMRVRRCEGKERDEGAASGQVLEELPDDIELRYWDNRYPFRRWDAPARRIEHHRSSRPICRQCVERNYMRRAVAWADSFLHNGPVVDKRRWFRLCKKHSESEAQRVNATRPLPNTVPQCACISHNRNVFKCNACVDEEDWDWGHRAQVWRDELLHTYKKHGRRRRPYVDHNKPARVRPACPYKDCGGRGWYNTLDADAVGLSVCLGCSALLIG
ncbi:MAG: hypothetical protein Q9216_004604 [Gyalolechia sp. 2 TL-2023]